VGVAGLSILRLITDNGSESSRRESLKTQRSCEDVMVSPHGQRTGTPAQGRALQHLRP
jgi:hypothetical protein